MSSPIAPVIEAFDAGYSQLSSTLGMGRPLSTYEEHNDVARQAHFVDVLRRGAKNVLLDAVDEWLRPGGDRKGALQMAHYAGCRMAEYEVHSAHLETLHG